MSEIWKAIPGFEGLYEVSDQGRVRSLDRVVACCGPTKGSYLSKKKGRMLRPGRMPSGHLSVVLGRDAGSFCVHVLVLLAFRGPCPVGLEVRHRNGVPSDNRLLNLEYATRTRNSQDKKHHNGARGYKLSPRQVAEIKKKLRYTTGVELSRQYGVAQSTVSAIKTGRFHLDVRPAL